MYLSNIKLWNFRKYGIEGEIDLDAPALDLNFTKGINVLIGANDSGKTAIVDAIKLVLKTHSYDWIRVVHDDFFTNATQLRIELIFDDLAEDEAMHFLEWLGHKKIEGKGDSAPQYLPFLRLIYEVNQKGERILPSEVRAGSDTNGSSLTPEAKEYLKVTYLKPLRDAKQELTPKQNSRLTQILSAHEAFNNVNNHELLDKFSEFNKSIENYFLGLDNNQISISDQKGKDLKDSVDKLIEEFYDPSKHSEFGVRAGSLKIF